VCLSVCIAVVDSVTITDQRVPSAVLNGTEYVVLDCVYRVKPEEAEGLVITWYFNNSPSPAYQWIQGQPPRAIGPLKNHIRLGFAAPTDDVLAKYRALYIIRPTIELTGNYKCVVSTYNDEDFMIKKMIVYGERTLLIRYIVYFSVMGSLYTHQWRPRELESPVK